METLKKRIVHPMNNILFFITKDNHVIDSFKISEICKIMTGKEIKPYDEESIRYYASNCIGIKKEIKNPTYLDLLRLDEKVKATKYYRLEHKDLSLSECKRIIDVGYDKIKSNN